MQPARAGAGLIVPKADAMAVPPICICWPVVQSLRGFGLHRSSIESHYTERKLERRYRRDSGRAIALLHNILPCELRLRRCVGYRSMPGPCRRHCNQFPASHVFRILICIVGTSGRCMGCSASPACRLALALSRCAETRFPFAKPLRQSQSHRVAGIGIDLCSFGAPIDARSVLPSRHQISCECPG